MVSDLCISKGYATFLNGEEIRKLGRGVKDGPTSFMRKKEKKKKKRKN